MEGMDPNGSAQLARLRGYLERDPENWTLRAELFDASLRWGDRAGARQLLDAALVARPDDAAWHHREAFLLLAEGRGAEAQLALEALLARGVDAPGIRHNLAFALFVQGRWAEASEAVAPLLDSADEVAGVAFALWLRCQHRLDRLPEALERFRQLAAARPLTPDAVGVASLIAFDEGAMDEAKALSDAALRARENQLEALATRGTLQLAALDAAGAQECFGRALRTNPGDGRAWAGMAAARMLTQDFRGATEAYARAVQGIPEHQGTWIGYGWALLLVPELQEARRVFERAVEIDRTVAEAHGGLAVALARLGDGAGARVEIEVANRLDRTNLSAGYAEAVLTGDADNLKRFQSLAARLLGDREAGAPFGKGRTLADVVFRRQRRR
jgi:tetratricopeptide (TPR) repeat protein